MFDLEVYTVIAGTALADLGNLFSLAHDRGFSIKRVMSLVTGDIGACRECRACLRVAAPFGQVKTFSSGHMTVHIELVGLALRNLRRVRKVSAARVCPRMFWAGQGGVEGWREDHFSLVVQQGMRQRCRLGRQ